MSSSTNGKELNDNLTHVSEEHGDNTAEFTNRSTREQGRISDTIPLSEQRPFDSEDRVDDENAPDQIHQSGDGGSERTNGEQSGSSSRKSAKTKPVEIYLDEYSSKEDVELFILKWVEKIERFDILQYSNDFFTIAAFILVIFRSDQKKVSNKAVMEMMVKLQRQIGQVCLKTCSIMTQQFNVEVMKSLIEQIHEDVMVYMTLCEEHRE